MKKLAIILTLSLFLYACGKEEKIDFQKQLKQAAELSTIECTITKVFGLTDNTLEWLGNRTVLFSCQATMKAGVDMDKFNVDDISISDEKITITLPAPEIFSYNIPPDEIKEIYSDLGVLRSNFSQKERDEVFHVAEEEIKGDEEILSSILKEAKESSKTFFEALLRQNGYSDININFKN